MPDASSRSIRDATIFAIGKRNLRFASHLWTFIFLSISVDAFNFDVRNAEVISHPSGCGDSLFGYSVAFLKEKGVTWLLVGAPQDSKDCQGSAKSLTRGGVIYKCRTDGGSDPCSPIPLPEMENSTHEGSHDVESSLTGWTIDVEDIEDGRIVVCSHHVMHHPSQCGVGGACYWLSGTKSEARKMTPFKQEITAHRKGSVCHTNQRGGFSPHFVKKTAEIIIGAPAAFNGHGAVAQYRDRGNRMGNQVLINNSTLPYSNYIASKPFLTKEMSHEAYFGYSISSGKFSQVNKTMYVASAPRSNSLKGKVFIFDFPENPGEPISMRFELEGSQLGEYFGYSLCVVDLDSDGLDDLVIGAPYHTLDDNTKDIHKHSWDEGRIYVYMNQIGTAMADSGLQIMGTKQAGARFGTSIANIGDINNDGFSDVAVGAPYEGLGHGAVYIYHGSRDGLISQYKQRISATEINHSLMGFGIAISNGTDLDGNNYNDIAIGAPLSGNVVLLKSRPIIKFQTSLTSNLGKMDVNANGFMRVCINYSGIHTLPSLVAAINLSAKKLAKEVKIVVNGTKHEIYTYYPELKNNIIHCDRFGLEIRVLQHQS
ncbi:integrin alpha-4-like [Ischnura elegans]|uniref:integrin alpha-4-like n=1 Tax=Ischnura elegans TaxID=197161 RepID=UPI001ED8A06C|nr:integrin alpha-4-like [Ischnura elegans]